MPLNPASSPWPSRDAGVFLYFGWRILNGELPYRDIWDHKPPVVFYVDAVGLAVAHGSRWGVWWIEVAVLAGSALLAYAALSKVFGKGAAVLSTLVALLSLPAALEGGNLTEEYALILQFMAIWLWAGLDPAKPSLRRLFAVGLLGGVAFFTKQTTIIIWIAFACHLTLERLRSGEWWSWFRQLGSMCLGSLLLGLLVLGFFSAQGSLIEFWDAAFRFNVVYSSGDVPIVTRLTQSLEGAAVLGVLWPLAILGYADVLVRHLIGKESLGAATSLRLVEIAGLPLEMLMIAAPGRENPHYYVTAVPVMSVLISSLAAQAESRLNTLRPSRPLRSLLLGAVAVAIGWMSWGAISARRDAQNRRAPEYAMAVEYLQLHSAVADRILVWGNEASVNFMAGRVAPTRFVYLFPLYQYGYGSKALVAEFLSALVQDPPRMIVSTGDPATPFMQFRNLTRRASQDLSLLESSYMPVQRWRSWTVYEYFPRATSQQSATSVPTVRASVTPSPGHDPAFPGHDTLVLPAPAHRMPAWTPQAECQVVRGGAPLRFGTAINQCSGSPTTCRRYRL